MQCPACGSDASYKYGRTKTGKERFLCLLCGRQFSLGSSAETLKDRPSCPACGRGMHIYKREPGAIRFRCSAYPVCATFLKVPAGQTRHGTN